MISCFRNTIVLFLCCLVLGCAIETDPKQVVLQSLEAHGGLEAWENAEEIRYSKRTITYDSLGAVKSDVVQEHINRFQPAFYAEMSTSPTDSIIQGVFLENDEVHVVTSGNQQLDDAVFEKFRKDMMGAHYVLWQPYKLLEPDAHLSYKGTKTMDNGKIADVVQVNYYNEDGSEGNTWWYYFDMETHKLLGNMVYHHPTYALIENLAYETKTGLSLNAERKSYRTDSLGNKKYLIAHYYYEILSFK